MYMKSWYQSKTVWFNLLAILVTMIVYMLEGIYGGTLVLPIDVDPELMILLIGAGNLILRKLTNQALR